ncbi:paraquat-inducible protein A [Anaerobiospirillum succiniciproducens]|uniref:paraquat-inducible protein A n=1 Tax=Anaerobiospirillum succiniciproducens TaxID=13335 RepID=UPI002943A597|nr:paraquat-inducible protein A [Anaerobiospirillum succiniciproducens]
MSLYNLAVVSIASVIMLFTSVTLPFMTISSLGISQSMSLTSIVFVLHKNWSLLVAIFLLFTFCCPLIMHLIVIGIVFFGLKVNRFIANTYTFCHRFCMVDVFLLGVMVSLIKLVSLADISFHPGFTSAIVFSVLMVWCYSHGSPYKIWNLIRPHDAELRNATVGMRGIDQGLIMCRHCGMVYKRKGRKSNKLDQELESSKISCADDKYLYRGEHTCPRCGHSNDNRSVMMYQKTAALLIAAVILYIPSNVYPIMFTNYLGSNVGSDILDGVISLWGMGSYFVASVILIASICIPIAKILCILLLLYITKYGFKGYPSRYNKLYRIILFIGRWSMIDVFVVIIMATVVRMSVLTISPGIAVVFFCFTVLVTMLAAEEYDERMLWDIALAKNRDSIINKDGELVANIEEEDDKTDETSKINIETYEQRAEEIAAALVGPVRIENVAKSYQDAVEKSNAEAVEKSQSQVAVDESEAQVEQSLDARKASIDLESAKDKLQDGNTTASANKHSVPKENNCASRDSSDVITNSKSTHNSATIAIRDDEADESITTAKTK